MGKGGCGTSSFRGGTVGPKELCLVLFKSAAELTTRTPIQYTLLAPEEQRLIHGFLPKRKVEVKSLHDLCLAVVLRYIDRYPSLPLDAETCRLIYNHLARKRCITLDLFKKFPSYALQKVSLISSIESEWFTTLSQQELLQSVEFVNCRLLDEHLPLLFNMKHLESLSIDRCLKLTPASLESISKLDTLTSLSLRRIPDVAANIQLIQSLTSLKELTLFKLKLEDVAFLSSLTGLNYLDLNGNEVQQIEPLKSLTGLHTLDLSGNKLPYSNIEHLKEMKHLKALYLSDTGLTAAVAQEFLVLDKLEVLDISRSRGRKYIDNDEEEGAGPHVRDASRPEISFEDSMIFAESIDKTVSQHPSLKFFAFSGQQVNTDKSALGEICERRAYAERWHSFNSKRVSKVEWEQFKEGRYALIAESSQTQYLIAAIKESMNNSRILTRAVYTVRCLSAVREYHVSDVSSQSLQAEEHKWMVRDGLQLALLKVMKTHTGHGKLMEHTTAIFGDILKHANGTIKKQLRCIFDKLAKYLFIVMRAHRERCNLHFHCATILNHLSRDSSGIYAVLLEGGVKEVLNELVTHRWAHLAETWKALYNLLDKTGWTALGVLFSKTPSLLAGLHKLVELADELDTQHAAKIFLDQLQQHQVLPAVKKN